MGSDKENYYLRQITESFGLGQKDVNAMPALTLAYLGDCIYELVIRTMLVERGITHVSELNKAAVKYVRASAQKDLFFAIEDELDEEETAVYKRGRNVKSSSCPKNASVADYHTATGFEALMGYLYAKGRNERLLELVSSGIGRLEGQKDTQKDNNT
ncbi:MAG: ribonuclease III [Lachnospiraceae bacterium]|nr:ribonuclease III [Lachnospiraceae bacterium]